MKMRRAFTQNERKALLVASQGKCAICGSSLGRKWHADHVVAWANGGKTIIKNGQALCTDCNLKKGKKFMPPALRTWSGELRRWQNNALAEIINRFATASRGPHPTNQKRFTLSAFPGSGKTTLALRVIYDWLSRLGNRKVIVVVPSRTLKRQFHRDADKYGILLSTKFGKENKSILGKVHGIVVTYAQIDWDIDKFIEVCSEYECLVVMDECHHVAGEDLDGETRAWGESTLEAFKDAIAILMMTGTPWRSDSHRIPFVEYDKDNNLITDHNYGYKEALIDTIAAGEDWSQKVCREILFISMGGEAEFFNGIENVRVQIDDKLEKELISRTLRTALDPIVGNWFRNWFIQADNALQAIRNAPEQAYPDAAGLVIGTTEWHVNQYAEIIKEVTGEDPWVVTYKEEDAMTRIEEFKSQKDKHGNRIKTPRWIVSINMISEGTDIPRLIVEFYATVVRQRLYFHQALGRVIRWDKDFENNRNPPKQQLARVYMPFVRPLTNYAEEIKKIIEHVLKERRPKAAGKEPGPAEVFVPKDSMDAPGDVILDEVRTEANYVKLARRASEHLSGGQYQSAELNAQLLKWLHENKVIEIHNDTVGPITRQSERTWEDDLEDAEDTFERLLKQVKRQFFTSQDDMQSVEIAIRAYIKNTLGFGSKHQWHDKVHKVIEIVSNWVSTNTLPLEIRETYIWIRNQGGG